MYIYICIFIYIYIDIFHYYTVFFQTSWISEAKRKGLPKTTPVQLGQVFFSLDQGHQRKSPRVNILRGIWTLMNGRRNFPCKFEVIEKTHPPHLCMIELLSQLHMKSQKSRTSSMPSPFFLSLCCHLGGQEKEKHWRWLAVRHFFRTRPSLRLSYSLPDLELVKDRAPEARLKSTKGLNFRSC